MKECVGTLHTVYTPSIYPSAVESTWQDYLSMYVCRVSARKSETTLVMRL